MATCGLPAGQCNHDQCASDRHRASERGRRERREDRIAFLERKVVDLEGTLVDLEQAGTIEKCEGCGGYFGADVLASLDGFCDECSPASEEYLDELGFEIGG